MTIRAGRGNYLVAERVARLRFVRVVGQKFDVFYAAAASAVFEAMVAVEIQVVTFLGKTAGALAVQADQHVVVKFAEIKKRAARAAKRVRGAGVFHE